jgi:hypothetical protein
VCVVFVYNFCSKRFLVPSNISSYVRDALRTHARLHVEVCVIVTKIKMCRHILKLTEIKLHENLSVRPDGRSVEQ